MNDDSETDIGRRTFMKAAGTVAGAGLLGVGTGSVAAADNGIDRRFLNWRTVEAQKVWERGYRGRPDRSLALTDSGVAARHPDIGPWNGVLADVKDGELKLTTDVDSEEQDTQETVTDLETFTQSGTIGPGTFAAGTRRTYAAPFVPSEKKNATDTNSETVSRIDATMTWTPPMVAGNGEDIEFVLQKRVDGSWEDVAISTNAGQPESIQWDVDEPGAQFRFGAETWANVYAQYEIEAILQHVESATTGGRTYHDVGDLDPFADVDPANVTPDTPKTVGWFDAGNRYGSFDRPRDPDGHGSHCSGIMAATGRASVVDQDNTEVHEPHAVLVPGDFVEYEVDVGADETVFASAFGEQVVVEIVHDGRVVHESPLRLDSIVADEPAVHDAETATYTVRVRPARTQDASAQGQDAPSDPEAGSPMAGRLNRIAVGTYRNPTDEVGDRVPDAGQGVHSGLAPNQSLVGLQGLSGATNALGSHASEFRDAFNVRAVNMSWGYAYGAPLGAAGGNLSDLPAQMKEIAQGGILPVAAAGNFPSPANGNGAPNGMDEPISVAATGPLDGLTTYSAGGIGTVDEDDDEGGTGVDRKPDVTAPGGDLEPEVATLFAGVSTPVPSYYELVRSVGAPSPDDTFEAGDPPRDFVSIGGTSMASPYTCGMTGLVAQAMEEDAPASIALPEPAETGFDDVMRLKQAVLATASETVFTAAPYHNAKVVPHPPTYEHGGRDPYEGYGRVNPDAAVDAVSWPLVAADEGALVDTASVDPGETASGSADEAVGLYVPEDSRAVAGYVEVPEGGSVSVDVAHGFYSGGNKGMAKDAPWLDLFVYDAETPAENGEPNIVTSVQARQGSGSVSVSSAGTYFVVAKIVNVPGAVNGFDVQSNFELSVSYTAPPLPTLSATGTRSDDGSAFTAGQTNQITLELTGISPQVDDDAQVRLYDQSPWPLTGFGNDDVSRADDGTVDLGTVPAKEIKNGTVTKDYFVEAPSSTGQYQFGAASIEIDAEGDLNGTTATYGGTERNVVVGTSTNTDEAASTTTEL